MEFFIVSFLALICTPLATIIVLVFRGRNFARNMLLLNPVEYRDAIAFWLMILFYYLCEQRDTLPISLFLIASIVMFFRALIISVRYATTTQSRMDYQTAYKFTIPELTEDLMLLTWSILDVRVFDREIRASMFRQ